MTENEISAQILDAAIAVHTELGGPGVLESYYEAALACELQMRGLKADISSAHRSEARNRNQFRTGEDQRWLDSRREWSLNLPKAAINISASLRLCVKNTYLNHDVLPE